jgi:hypothetical protein
MAIEVIKGPMETPPAWSPSVVTFVRTRMGLRELGEPRVHGTFADQAKAWLKDITMGGKPQFWQVDVSEIPHPEVKLDLSGKGGILNFDIRLHFNVRVANARAVLERNVRNLEGYFTAALRGALAPITDRYDMSQSAQLQHAILTHLGGGNRFTDDRVEALYLTVQVKPADSDAMENMKKSVLVPTQQAAIDARVQITKAEMDAFNRETGGMTIDALARAAIATGAPRLIDAYNKLHDLHMAEDQRNWERLKFLVDNKIIEPHHLEKHLGPLSPDLIRRLMAGSGIVPAPKQIGTT